MKEINIIKQIQTGPIEVWGMIMITILVAVLCYMVYKTGKEL
jgi:hypothetical protein